MATAAVAVVIKEEALPLAVELLAGANSIRSLFGYVHFTVIVCSSGIEVGANAFR
jgi:hypothetical protein